VRSCSACVLLNAQNLADRNLTYVDSIVSRSGLPVQWKGVYRNAQIGAVSYR
jgi:hypothetical protein